VRIKRSPIGERNAANPPPLCPIRPDTPPPLTRSPSPLKRGGFHYVKGGASRFVRAITIPDSSFFTDKVKSTSHTTDAFYLDQQLVPPSHSGQNRRNDYKVKSPNQLVRAFS